MVFMERGVQGVCVCVCVCVCVRGGVVEIVITYHHLWVEKKTPKNIEADRVLLLSQGRENMLEDTTLAVVSNPGPGEPQGFRCYSALCFNMYLGSQLGIDFNVKTKPAHPAALQDQGWRPLPKTNWGEQWIHMINCLYVLMTAHITAVFCPTSRPALQ